MREDVASCDDLRAADFSGTWGENAGFQGDCFGV